MNAMNTLITTVKFVTESKIPSQIEIMGNPIYENGKVKSFEIDNKNYNYDEKNSLNYTIENFNMTVEGLSECNFNGYFTFNVLNEGKAEFELCVIIENVHDDLIDNIDTLFIPNNISISDFVFKDDCYFLQLDMKITEVIEAKIDDIW